MKHSVLVSQWDGICTGFLQRNILSQNFCHSHPRSGPQPTYTCTLVHGFLLPILRPSGTKYRGHKNIYMRLGLHKHFLHHYLQVCCGMAVQYCRRLNTDQHSGHLPETPRCRFLQAQLILSEFTAIMKTECILVASAQR